MSGPAGCLHLSRNLRIPPPRFTSCVEHEAASGWRNRLQAWYSGSRSDAADEKPGNLRIVFGQVKVEDYVVFDWQSSLPLAIGTLRLGVEKLLAGQRQPLQGAGAYARLGYSFEF